MARIKPPCPKCGAEIPKDAKGNYSIDKACADPCLGVLPGVSLACCGHGNRENAHIVFENGVVVRGFDYIEHHIPRRRRKIIDLRVGVQN